MSAALLKWSSDFCSDPIIGSSETRIQARPKAQSSCVVYFAPIVRVIGREVAGVVVSVDG